MAIVIRNYTAVNCGTAVHIEGDHDLQIDGFKAINCDNGFVQIDKQLLYNTIQNEYSGDNRNALIDAARRLETATSRADGKVFYDRIVSLAANHMTVIQPIITAIYNGLV